MNISEQDAAKLLTDLNKLFSDMLVQKFKPGIELDIAEIAVGAVEKIIDTYVMAEVAAFNAAPKGVTP